MLYKPKKKSKNVTTEIENRHCFRKKIPLVAVLFFFPRLEPQWSSTPCSFQEFRGLVFAVRKWEAEMEFSSSCHPTKYS
eukprot:5396051-Amphidinium_carterae.1